MLRLISQDGSIDVPYEGSVIENSIKYSMESGKTVGHFCITAHYGGETYKMAEYSTDGLAKMVIELMNVEYLRHDFKYGYNFPKYYMFQPDSKENEQK